jgi:hypothetical protein
MEVAVVLDFLKWLFSMLSGIVLRKFTELVDYLKFSADFIMWLSGRFLVTFHRARAVEKTAFHGRHLPNFQCEEWVRSYGIIDEGVCDFSEASCDV